MHNTSTVTPAAAVSGACHPAPQDRTPTRSAGVRKSAQSVSEPAYKQLSLDVAIEAGQAGMAQALDSAERRDPLFKEKAEAAIVACLHACKQRRASSEDLVDAARAAGLNPGDGRAFGPIFQSMAKRGVIRCLRSDLPRRHGHGTSGGRLWTLCG